MKAIMIHLLEHLASQLEKHKSPTFIQYTELQRRVMADMREELNHLYKCGKIKVGQTINDKYIQVIENGTRKSDNDGSGTI